MSHFIQNRNNSIEDLSTRIHRRIQSIEKLLKAAEIVNEGWTPFQYKYFITIVRSMGQNILQTAGTTALSTFDRLVYFKSSNAVKQVVDPLGEETIMNALVFE